MSIPSRGAAVAVSALVLSLAACSSGSSPHATATGISAGPQVMLGATFSGTIYVSTALGGQVTKPFVQHVPNVANCAAAAAKGDFGSTFRVPTASLPDPQANILIADFHGPGTYPPADLAKDTGDAIMMPGKGGTSRYYISSRAAGRPHGKEVLFLSKDGSGQLVYSDAHLNGQASSPAAAGLIQWSCKS
jgi:hypothetical protein